MVDGIYVWGGGMTTASGCSDVGGPEVDAVGADGCGGVCFESGGGGGGGDGVGEWSGLIGLVEVRSRGGLSI